MTKAAASLAAVALLGVSVLGQPSPVKAQPYGYPPERVEWTVAPGYFGFGAAAFRGPDRRSRRRIFRPTLWLLLYPRAIEKRMARG